MKIESRKRSEHILFLATENVILHVNQPYTIRQDMIESKNFIPEAFLMHQFHESKDFGIQSLRTKLSEEVPGGPAGPATPFDPFSRFVTRGEEVSYFSDEDDEDEDWDEDEDEDWDEEDEDWDEEDEEWDDEDEEWDNEDEDLDEGEDWSDDDAEE